MSKLFLITGATGFVGSQLVKSVLEKGNRCRIVVRKKSKYFFGDTTKFEKIIETSDIFSESVDWWTTVTQGVDVLIHAAWYAEPGKYLTSLKNFDCLVGSLNMAKGAVQSGVNKIVGIGSCFEYDLNFGILKIDTPLNPITPYATSKVCLYNSLIFFLNQHNVKFNWCRLFYLYGEGEDEKRFFAMLNKNLSNGKEVELTSGNQIRDYLNVKDAANLIISIALDNDDEIVYNICSGVPITIRQFAENIADFYESRHLLKFGKRQSNLIDPLIVLGVPNYINSNEKN
jgi:nucleoside-diphosphate-sugar epimerase